jgi:hypothetical protein
MASVHGASCAAGAVLCNVACRAAAGYSCQRSGLVWSAAGCTKQARCMPVCRLALLSVMVRAM